MAKPTITLIGYGRLGQHLCRWLINTGYTVKGVYNRSTMPMNPELFQAHQQGEFPKSREELGDLIIICVSDSAIESVSAKLSQFDLSGLCVVHTAGAIPSSILAPLRDGGAHIGSFHPLQTFGPVGKKNPFKGISVSIEGDWKCIEFVLEMVRALGGLPLQTDAKGKALMHLACIWASNYLYVLLDAASRTGSGAGIQQSQLITTLMPIIEQTLANAKEIGTATGLTGPASRGDIGTIQKHIQLLETTPELQNLYLTLAESAANIANRRGSLPNDLLEELKSAIHENRIG